MTAVDRLYAIVEQGLCIGCGLCESVAGPDIVRMATTHRNELRPVVVGPLDDGTVDVIYDVCPGTRVEGLPDDRVDADTVIDPIWGPWRRMVRAWAGEPMVRFEGSTGGVLTALGRFLVRSGRVAFVLHTTASTAEPTFGERTLSFTEAEVLEAAGSRYGPTATLVDVGAVLDRGEPFAFIGKPCDVAALRNWGRHDPRVDELIRYWLTLVCGGYGPPAFTDEFLSGVGVPREELTGFRYRGRGCPGPTVAETPSKTVVRHYLDFWGEDSSQWSLPWRCKICPDGIGEAADLAAADTWPGGSPSREESATDPGTNAVIVRTAAGGELLDAAEAAGAVVIERDIGPAEMSDYQPHQVAKKRAVASRHTALEEAGRIRPQTARLRIDEIGAEMGADFDALQRRGTLSRIEIGKATEPRPG